jgi:outer membrane immunogenic protein
MRTRIGCLLIVAIGLGGLESALAADLPAKAPFYKAPVGAQPYDWGGLYVGANAGSHTSRDDDPAFDSFDANWGPGTVALFNQAAPVSLRQSGFAGGFHIGYNWQKSNFVYGLEADIDALNGSASRNLILPVPIDTVQFTDSAKDRWMSTVRVRAGMAFNQVLIFGTAGLAVSSWQLDHSFAQIDFAGATNGTISRTVTRTGWVAGGGVEYALDNNWSLRGEYLHADFGTTTSTLYSNETPPAFATIFTHPEKLTEDVVRGGVSYKFGGL